MEKEPLMIDCKSICLNFSVGQIRLQPLLPNVFIDTSLSGSEKVEKIDAFIYACLIDTQEDEIVADSPLIGISLNHIPDLGESLNGVFSVIIIPRNTIVVKKREQSPPILP